MHDCPRCGQACDCSGDIDDCYMLTEEWALLNCNCDCDEPWEEEPDEGLIADCGNPACLMPGYHLRSECYTAEDLEAYYEDEGVMERPSIFSTIDFWLAHIMTGTMPVIKWDLHFSSDLSYLDIAVRWTDVEVLLNQCSPIWYKQP